MYDILAVELFKTQKDISDYLPQLFLRNIALILIKLLVLGLPFLFRFCVLFDLLEWLLAQFHDDVNPIVFDPAVEISNNVRTFCLDAESRERLHLLEVERLLIWISNAVAGHLDCVLKLIGVVLTFQNLTKVAFTQNTEPRELLIQPRNRWLLLLKQRKLLLIGLRAQIQTSVRLWIRSIPHIAEAIRLLRTLELVDAKIMRLLDSWTFVLFVIRLVAFCVQRAWDCTLFIHWSICSWY